MARNHAFLSMLRTVSSVTKPTRVPEISCPDFADCEMRAVLAWHAFPISIEPMNVAPRTRFDVLEGAGNAGSLRQKSAAL